MASFHPTIQPKVHIPDLTHPTFYSTTTLQLFRVSPCAPPSLQANPPSARNPFLTAPMG